MQLIAANEKATPKQGYVGNFELRENRSTEWVQVRAKLERFARDNGANLIQVHTIGWGKKGNAFYADGSLYYETDTLRGYSETSGPCTLYVMRDATGGPIGSIFKISIRINDTLLGTLSQKSSLQKPFVDCNAQFTLGVNNKNYPVQLNGESRYFWVTKQTTANGMDAGIGIGVGGVNIVEMKDKDLARLLLFQN